MCVEYLLCCWKRMFAMTSAYSWQNSVSLCLSHFVIACYSRYFLTSYFRIQSPMMKRTSFFIQFSFFSTRGWGIGLDYCDIEWLSLETNILPFLRLHPSTAFRTLLLTVRAIPFLLRDSCPQCRYNGHLN